MLKRVKLILKIFFHPGPHASLYSDGEKDSQLGNVTKEDLGERLKGVIVKEGLTSHYMSLDSMTFTFHNIL